MREVEADEPAVIDGDESDAAVGGVLYGPSAFREAFEELLRRDIQAAWLRWIGSFRR